MFDLLIGPWGIALFLFILFYACAYCVKIGLDSIVKSNKKNRIRRRSTVIGVLGVEPAQDQEQLIPKKGNATPNLQAPSAEDSDLAQLEKQTELSEKCDDLMHLLEGTGENKNFSI